MKFRPLILAAAVAAAGLSTFTAVGPAILHARYTLGAAVRRTLQIVEPIAGAVRWFAHRSSV